jgi:hypothetical protein
MYVLRSGHDLIRDLHVGIKESHENCLGLVVSCL